MPTDNYIDLLTLQRYIKEGVESSLPGSIWVKAEISSINQNAVSGHCYLELCQSEKGTVRAKVRAAIWKSRYPFLSKMFREVTGSLLSVGQEVLVRVQVSYSEMYGLTLSVDAIEPEFTLGKKEALKKETIKKLTDEGLIDRQKRLTLTEAPYRLAVISSATAAGLGDFNRHLKENQWGFRYKVVLYEATMQGDAAPSSISQALKDVLSSALAYDAILILRGGGSELDLSCFDDYSLAKAIALTDIPVFTAIGHDRDSHVADMVAFKAVKTPTALADLFVDATVSEDMRISALESSIMRALSTRLASLEAGVDSIGEKISHGVKSRLSAEESKVESLSVSILSASKGRVGMALAKVDSLSALISAGHHSAVRRNESLLDSIALFLKASFLRRIESAEAELRFTEMRISTTDPRNAISAGKSLVADAKGVRFSSVKERRPGDSISVWMEDGKLDCLVQKVSLSGDGEDENTGTMTA